ELPARRRGQSGRLAADVGGVEVQPRDRVAALRLLGLLLDVDGRAGPIEAHHAVAFRVTDPEAEDGGVAAAGRGALQLLAQSEAVEDVIAQHQRRFAPAQEALADQERLRDALGPRLLRVLESHAPRRPVTEKLAER